MNPFQQIGGTSQHDNNNCRGRGAANKILVTMAVVIPAYNEVDTIGAVVRRCMEQILKGVVVQEIIIVDDGSSDGTTDVARNLVLMYPGLIKLIEGRRNLGKGAALRKGFAAASSDLLIIQDADMEYDPNCWPSLIDPILDGIADVVYGSRFSNRGTGRVLRFWHTLGNRAITLLCNMVGDLDLSDMETGYKVFTRAVYKNFELREARFGIEPEITLAIRASGYGIYEVPVTYCDRSYADGKKLGWIDAASAIRAIFYQGFRYRFLLRR